MNKIKKVRWVIVFFIAPAFILYTWFLAIPILNSLRLSFYTGNLFRAQEFVGLANYIKIFTQPPFNERLLGAFINNFKFFIILVIVQNLGALILALVLSRRFRGSEFFRTIYFIPTTLSVLVVGFLFNLMLNPVWGIFDKILRAIGLNFLIRPWLGDPLTALPTISLIGAWQYIGIPLILFTAGISGIDKEILEAARVDGASPSGITRHIILPLLKPVVGIVIILTFIGNFTHFDLVYAISTTTGNPNYTTDIFGTFFYRTTFGRGAVSFNPDIGLGATIATIMFIIIFIGVIIWLLAFRRKEEA
jgi:raffinose/stachyose/melibiose transport system permease protein